jgi:hypothetical protein
LREKKESTRVLKLVLIRRPTFGLQQNPPLLAKREICFCS